MPITDAPFAPSRETPTIGYCHAQSFLNVGLVGRRSKGRWWLQGGGKFGNASQHGIQQPAPDNIKSSKNLIQDQVDDLFQTRVHSLASILPPFHIHGRRDAEGNGGWIVETYLAGQTGQLWATVPSIPIGQDGQSKGDSTRVFI